MKLRTLIGGVGVAMWLGGTAAAPASEALLNKMVEKGYLTQREANEIREQMGAEEAANVEAYNKTKVSSWIDQMKWSGDLRLRTEFFDNEDQSNQVDRWRFRYRFRLGMEAKFVEWATVGFRLAIGDASDPVSTNETFDDTFQKDPIQIDAAYVIIQPPAWDWTSATAGKMNNPFWHPAFGSPMIYDGDLTPEGVAEQFNWMFGDQDRHAVFINAGQFLLNEISGSADTDGFIYDAQGGVQMKFGKDPKNPVLAAKAGGGFFWTVNADANDGLTRESPNVGNAVFIAAGSGTTVNTNFLADFEVVYVGGEVAWQLCDRPFLGTPAIITVSGEYVQNLANAFETLAGATNSVSPDQTEGYAGQIAFGSDKKKRQWKIAYQYKHLEADAVFDSLTDSDFGTGGTDRKGHVVKATYNFQDWWQLGLTAFITEKISSRGGANSVSVGDPAEELLRVQIDNVWKF